MGFEQGVARSENGKLIIEDYGDRLVVVGCGLWVVGCGLLVVCWRLYVGGCE